MYYISLDLEWNQAYAQKALAVQKKLCARLRGEVIQIGAVKLNQHMVPCGSYQIIIKPKYFKKLHRHVSELTGITQQQMDMGTPLTEAAERFRAFCGKDFAFLTWGPDDIPMLKENFHVNDIPSEWLNRTYDLQTIFNQQTDGLHKQRSLEYAMEYFGIPQNLPAHDALNDAYFTALVAAKLDVPAGIRAIDEQRDISLSETVLGDADAGDDGFVTVNELLDDPAVKEPLCPYCKKPMIRTGKLLHSKGQKYSVLFHCKADGDTMMVLRLHRNFNETWRARLQLEKPTEPMLEKYREGLAAAESQKKTRNRRYRKKRHAKPVSVVAEKS